MKMKQLWTLRPILKPLDENNNLFVFENLERNPDSGKDVLKEIIAEAVRYGEFGKDRTIDQKLHLVKKEEVKSRIRKAFQIYSKGLFLLCAGIPFSLLLS